MAHYNHILTIQPEAGKISILSFSPTKSLLASGSFEGLVQIWDLKSRVPTKELKLRSAILSLAWDTCSERLFIGCKNGTILSLDASAQQSLRVIRVSDRSASGGVALKFPVDALTINSEGQLAHTAGRHVLFYHLVSHQNPVGMKALPAPIDRDIDLDSSDVRAWIRAQGLHYINDEKLAVCYGKLNCIVAWDLTNRQIIWRSAPIFGVFSFSSISKKGDWVTVPDAHSGVHVVPLAENKSSFSLRYYPDPFADGINFGVAFTSNNVLVASGHRGRVVIWNVFTRRITQILNHPDRWFRTFAAKDDGGISYIAAATAGSGEIMLFATPYMYRERRLAVGSDYIAIMAKIFLAVVVVCSCVAVAMTCIAPSSAVKDALIFVHASISSTKLKMKMLIQRGLIAWFLEVNRRLRILVWRWLGLPDFLLPVDVTPMN